MTANGGDEWPFVTGGMVDVLITLGFVEVPLFNLQPGDIVWKPGHVEMVYQNAGQIACITMGAHSAGYSLENQVSINSEAKNNSRWTNAYRYGSGGAVLTPSSLYVVAAICGNLWQESNINPELWEGLRVGTWGEMRHGYGLGQWTNTGSGDGMRLLNFYNWMTAGGFDLGDAAAQWQYVITENIWYPTQEAAGYANLQAFLQSTSTDLAALTHAWSIGWEGIHDSSWDLRVEYAEKCLNYTQLHATDTTITTWSKGNRYLPEADILNNAVLLYRLLSAGGGGGGSGTLVANKSPFWMLLKWGLF